MSELEDRHCPRSSPIGTVTLIPTGKNMGKWILAGLLAIAAPEVLRIFDNAAEAQVVVVPSYGPIYAPGGPRFGYRQRFYPRPYPVVRPVVTSAPYYAASPFVYASAPSVYAAPAPVFVTPTRYVQSVPFIARPYRPMDPVFNQGYYGYPY